MANGRTHKERADLCLVLVGKRVSSCISIGTFTKNELFEHKMLISDKCCIYLFIYFILLQAVKSMYIRNE